MKAILIALVLAATPAASGAQETAPAVAETLARVVTLPEVVVSTARSALTFRGDELFEVVDDVLQRRPWPKHRVHARLLQRD